MSGSCGPFVPDLDRAERLARLRSLRALVKVLAGGRGQEAAIALLRAEIAGDDPEILAEAESAFRRLGTLDQRRVLAIFADVQAPNLRLVHAS